MPTNRVPISRPLRTPRFTPAALEAFRKMKRLARECSCPPRDWDGEYWNRTPCAACDAWWEQHHILRVELKTKRWEIPCIEAPDTVSGYPEGSYKAKKFKPDLEGQARYRELEAALQSDLQKC